MTQQYFLGIDQGTSGSKAVIVDETGRLCGYGYRPLARLYPQPDWVEQDPLAISQGVADAITDALGAAGIVPAAVQAAGLTCQRNTIIAWDAETGAPIGNAITWQDLRVLPLVKAAGSWDRSGEIRRRLGYPPGPYMGALHLAWRRRHDPDFQAAQAGGRLRLGLSAAWLLAARGQPAGHHMDTSLVQATGLYDFGRQQYWSEWLEWLGLTADGLPAPTPTLFDYGTLTITAPDGRQAAVPVRAMIGDQQAALFGRGQRKPGAAECTHGTASYVKVFLGNEPIVSDIANVYFAWNIGQGQTYCLEAATTVTGAALRWLRQQSDTTYEALAQAATTVPDAGGLVFVPALTGLNAPYDDYDARGAFLGLSLGHQRGHQMHAFYEAIGCQMRAILEAIAPALPQMPDQLLVAGGVSASDLACQIQADLTRLPVHRPSFTDTTAWAAALLAGLAAGVWTETELPPLPGSGTHFAPRQDKAASDRTFTRWQQAVDLVRAWGQQSS